MRDDVALLLRLAPSELMARIDRVVAAEIEASWKGAQRPEDAAAIEAELAMARAELAKLIADATVAGVKAERDHDRPRYYDELPGGMGERPGSPLELP